MKKLFAVSAIMILCLIPFFPVPASAIEGNIFLDKIFTDQGNSNIGREPFYSLNGEIYHTIGRFTPYAKGAMYMDSTGFSVLTKEITAGTEFHIDKNIVTRAGYILKKFPDGQHENLYLIGIGYRFGK